MSNLTKSTTVYTLNNGVKIPAIGLGTWQSEKGKVGDAVRTALQAGYRHIDGAAIYGNEEEVGQGIVESQVPRDEIFLTTKLWNTQHKEVEKALDESLNRLKVDYVDLYLIHWPVAQDPKTEKEYPDWDYLDTYKELQKVYKNTKKVRAIGVSNFTQKQLERLLADKDVDVVPAVNQIEAHPLLQQPELYQLLKKNNIRVEAYSPLGSTEGSIRELDEVKKIANDLGITPAQVLVSWNIQRGDVVLPKSVTPERIQSNLLTLELPKDVFDELNALGKKHGTNRTNVPPFFDFDAN